jgi:hypothetical protein
VVDGAPGESLTESGIMNSKEIEMGPISFSNWAEVLRGTKMSDAKKRAYQWAVIRFLKHCKDRSLRASVPVAKAFCEAEELKGDTVIREALRWFVMEARSAGSGPVASGKRLAVRDGRSPSEDSQAWEERTGADVGMGGGAASAESDRSGLTRRREDAKTRRDGMVKGEG